MRFLVLLDKPCPLILRRTHGEIHFRAFGLKICQVVHRGVKARPPYKQDATLMRGWFCVSPASTTCDLEAHVWQTASETERARRVKWSVLVPFQPILDAETHVKQDRSNFDSQPTRNAPGLRMPCGSQRAFNLRIRSSESGLMPQGSIS